LTVCATAICTVEKTLGGRKYAILGISDRMITSGDIEFEQPNHTKVFQLAGRAMSLASGDIECCTEVIRDTIRLVGNSGVCEIYDIAKIQCKKFEEYRRSRAESAYLHKFGLNMESFVSRQNQMTPEFFLKIESQIDKIRLGVETIIAGFDSDVPNIICVGDVFGVFRERCQDAIGFCSVGSGARQFESLFMSSRYDTSWRLPDALLLMYTAKKKAEASPGVGCLTDMCIIDDKGFRLLEKETVDALDEYYQESERAAQGMRLSLVGKMRTDKRIFPEAI